MIKPTDGDFQQKLAELLEEANVTRAIADHKTAKSVLFPVMRKGMLNRIGLQWNPRVGLRIVADTFIEREEEVKDGMSWALLLTSLGFNVVEVEGDLVWYEPRLSKQMKMEFDGEADAEVTISNEMPQLPEGDYVPMGNGDNLDISPSHGGIIEPDDDRILDTKIIEGEFVDVNAEEAANDAQAEGEAAAAAAAQSEADAEAAAFR